MGLCIAILVIALIGATGYISYDIGHSDGYNKGYSSGYETAGRNIYCEACYEGYLKIDPDHDNCVETCIVYGITPEIFWSDIVSKTITIGE